MSTVCQGLKPIAILKHVKYHNLKNKKLWVDSNIIELIKEKNTHRLCHKLQRNPHSMNRKAYRIYRNHFEYTLRKAVLYLTIKSMSRPKQTINYYD